MGYLSYEPLLQIRLGPLAVSPHGLGIAIGFLAGARLLMPTALRMGISADQVYAMLTRAAIGAVVGARLAYVLNHLGDYESILEVFEVWEGGISLLGGIFGAVLFAAFKMRSERLSFWKVMDAAAPGLALGIFVGRIGDLVIADHLGKPTSFFLGYRCPSVPTGSPCEPGTVVHQTALYDFMFAGLLLIFLLRLRRTRRYDGFLILTFAACYGAMRVAEDFLREDVRHFGLTGSQITAGLTCLLCLSVLVVRRRTPSWGRWDELSEPEPEPETRTRTRTATAGGETVIVRIGVTYSSKEIEVEVGDDVGRDSVVKDLETALVDGKVLWLRDRKGRTVGVPAEKVAYLEIGMEAGERRVGFSAI